MLSKTISETEVTPFSEYKPKSSGSAYASLKIQKMDLIAVCKLHILAFSSSLFLFYCQPFHSLDPLPGLSSAASHSRKLFTAKIIKLSVHCPPRSKEIRDNVIYKQVKM